MAAAVRVAGRNMERTMSAMTTRRIRMIPTAMIVGAGLPRFFERLRPVNSAPLAPVSRV